MIEKFGSERVIGMVHSFLLLKPIIQEALEYEEQQILRLNGKRLTERQVNEMLFKMSSVDVSLSDACKKLKESIDSLSNIALNN